MDKLDNLVGMKFGRLLVIERAPSRPRKNGGAQVCWKCKCDCGNEVTVRGGSLRGGRTTSCGCYRRENLSYYRTHRAINKEAWRTSDKQYNEWEGMIQRCFNKNNRSYPYYGGRGITVCERWRKSYDEFLHDVGRRPSEDVSLDRINNNGNYEPGNVRWATHSQQMRNRRPFQEWRNANGTAR